jgi:hypothetical protein
MRIETGGRLGEAYDEANLPLAGRRMKAGARMASVLTDTLRPR